MDKKKIGIFLKQLREEKGIELEDLTKYIDVPVKTIEKWENGKRLPKMRDFALLSFWYEMSINELINGERKSMKDDDMIFYYAMIEKRNEKIKIISLFALIALLVLIIIFTI